MLYIIFINILIDMHSHFKSKFNITQSRKYFTFDKVQNNMSYTNFYSFSHFVESDMRMLFIRKRKNI